MNVLHVCFSEAQCVDLQLPETKRVEIFVPVVNEPKVKIKEKKFDSLREVGEESIKQELTFFKKRKPNPNRGNIRQRLDDEWLYCFHSKSSLINSGITLFPSIL